MLPPLVVANDEVFSKPVSRQITRYIYICDLSCDECFFLSNCSLCALQCQQVLCASRVTSPVIVEPTFSPNVIYCSPQQCAATVTWHFHNFTWPRANKFRPNLGEAGRTHRGVGVLQIIVMKKNFIFCVFC